MTLGRTKTYTAQTGYVYEYRLMQKRPARPVASYSGGTEYLFEVSSDRKTAVEVSVVVTEDAPRAWLAAKGRELVEPELHAAAKVRLWQAFDEMEATELRSMPLLVHASNIVELLDQIGVD